MRCMMSQHFKTLCVPKNEVRLSIGTPFLQSCIISWSDIVLFSQPGKGHIGLTFFSVLEIGNLCLHFQACIWEKGPKHCMCPELTWWEMKPGSELFVGGKQGPLRYIWWMPWLAAFSTGYGPMGGPAQTQWARPVSTRRTSSSSR